MTPLLDFGGLQFRYEPFPIGSATPIMPDEEYARLVSHFPKPELFMTVDKLGKKFALSEKYNPIQFRSVVKEQPVWREFHRWIKSPDFLEMVLGALAEREIDLGVTPRVGVRTHIKIPLPEHERRVSNGPAAFFVIHSPVDRSTRGLVCGYTGKCVWCGSSSDWRRVPGNRLRGCRRGIERTR